MTFLAGAAAILMRWIAVLLLTSATVVSLFLVLYLIFHYLGLWFGLASLPLFPIALFGVPLYEGFVHGNWVSAVTFYGGGLLGASLYAASRWIDPYRQFLDPY